MSTLRSSGGVDGASKEGDGDKDSAEREAQRKAQLERDVARGYEERRERFDWLLGGWKELPEVNETRSDAILFTVKHRTWPKSKDYAHEQDYISVEIISDCLVDVVRDVALEVEEAYDAEVSLDTNHLYLHIEDFRQILRDKEETLATRRVVTDDPSKVSAPEAREGAGTAEAATTATTEDLSVESLQTHVAHLTVLVDFVDKLYAPIKEKLARLSQTSQISFSLLWAIFPVGSIIEIVDTAWDEKMCMELTEAEYESTRDGVSFRIKGMQIFHDGTRFTRSTFSTNIPSFKSVKPLSSLPGRPVRASTIETLRERGRKYIELSRVAFVEYKGSLGYYHGPALVKVRAEGRAVVDTKNFRRMNPNSIRAVGWSGDEDPMHYRHPGNILARYARRSSHVDRMPVVGLSALGAGDKVPEELLHLLPPTVFGFSLVQREWGEMLVNQFEEIKFNEKAWDQLVLDEDQKDLIRGLVEQSSLNAKEKVEIGMAVREKDAEKGKGVKEKVAAEKKLPKVHDFVSGKGGGLVIALHGRPGVGKTLTAEAIAEHRKVPLYSLGAGELGVTADELEERLRDALDLASSWGAVLLIDEADVFLEERGLHEIMRNAMVSCFLRMLEYHSGILILTTNRIRTIDTAFLSRFSLAITYPDLDADKRKKIWKSFIELAGIQILDADASQLPTPPGSGEVTPSVSGISAKYLNKLAQKPFNGRSIKNTVRTAQALAASKGEELSEKQLGIVAVRLWEKNLEDLKEADEEGIYDAKGEGWKDRQNLFT
ncbi:AAA family ATPase [Pseudohyphozyma bogoriensis]|nr:AAA family ATPase [Pseudohyphozyma bogoriensis]